MKKRTNKRRNSHLVDTKERERTLFGIYCQSKRKEKKKVRQGATRTQCRSIVHHVFLSFLLSVYFLSFLLSVYLSSFPFMCLSVSFSSVWTHAVKCLTSSNQQNRTTTLFYFLLQRQFFEGEIALNGKELLIKASTIYYHFDIVILKNNVIVFSLTIQICRFSFNF